MHLLADGIAAVLLVVPSNHEIYRPVSGTHVVVGRAAPRIGTDRAADDVHIFHVV